jgi:hypothetical protein
MAILETNTPRRKGAVRGREGRNQTLTTKLTQAESAAVEAAEADRKSVGEWLRDVASQAVRPHSDATEVLLTEIVGLRLFLNNQLSRRKLQRKPGVRSLPTSFSSNR